jgi:hypothetical protein
MDRMGESFLDSIRHELSPEPWWYTRICYNFRTIDNVGTVFQRLIMPYAYNAQKRKTCQRCVFYVDNLLFLCYT